LERLSLKKVRLRINLGIVGMKGSGKELFPQYLDHIAIQSQSKDNIHEYLVLHQEIPFKIKLVTVEYLDQLIDKNSKFKQFDVLIININIYDTQSINHYTPSSINEFISKYNFQGLTLLVGVDSYYLEKGVPSEYFRISRLNLRNKTNQLDFIYCYEIQNKHRDIKEILEQIFNDISLRFQTSNPELLDHARNYGQQLLLKEKLNR